MLQASDFYDDDVYLRKMKRAMELAKRRQQVEDDEDDEENDDDVPDASIVAGRSVNVKKERRTRTHVVDSDEE